MKWKEIAADYFTYSRKEMTGILTLLVLVFITAVVPKIVNITASPIKTDVDTSWIAAIKQLEIKNVQDSGSRYSQFASGFNAETPSFEANEAQTASPVKLFEFDPNTLPAAQWELLGIQKKTIHTIQNYLAKGGRFRRATDLKKIYGLSQQACERLMPYIVIQQSNTKTFNKADNSPNNEWATKKNASRYSPLYTSLDINTADSMAFIKLPGIGAKLAARIIKFREKLGGFYAIEQVKETFGLPDSTFQKIEPYLVVNSSAIQKIQVNTAGIETLQAHPYIRYVMANAIINYRNQHGPFSTPESIKKVMLITEDIYKKLSPYLITGP